MTIEPWCNGKNLMLGVLGVTNIIMVSILIVDFSPVWSKYELYMEVNSNDSKQEVERGAPPLEERRETEIVGRVDPADWTKYSLEWWENEALGLTDPNWRGRHRMHEKLKSGNVWFDENVEEYFIGKLEEHQFPSNCSKNHWIAYQPMDSGLLSCVHVITPVLMMGLMKGDEYTVIPIGYLVDPLRTNPTYDGCGERKDKHLGCFFNLTSCRVEDDEVRYNALITQSRSRSWRGYTWSELMSRTTVAGGMSVVRNWVWPTEKYRNSRIEEGSKKPKVRFWNEIRKHGSVGVYGLPEEAVEHIWEDQMEFALTSMMSSWMLRQLSTRVRNISDEIMAKYSDATGRPLWKAPVLTVHVRRTDKALEDPYFQKHHAYRNLSDYVTEMMTFEAKYDFKWQSMFLISDAGSAMQALAQAVNNMSGSPDSANGEEGKRFIMYDWTDDTNLIESFGDHNHIPQEKKYSAQEHFLATLYIIEKISDYAIVSFSSNVGRFISELIGSRHRVACADRVGPNALSMDYEWRHD